MLLTEKVGLIDGHSINQILKDPSLLLKFNEEALKVPESVSFSYILYLAPVGGMQLFVVYENSRFLLQKIPYALKLPLGKFHEATLMSSLTISGKGNTLTAPPLRAASLGIP